MHFAAADFYDSLEHLVQLEINKERAKKSMYSLRKFSDLVLVGAAAAPRSSDHISSRLCIVSCYNVQMSQKCTVTPAAAASPRA